MINELLSSLDDEISLADWQGLPSLVHSYTIATEPVFAAVKEAANTLPFDSDREVWFNPERRVMWVSWSPQDTDARRDMFKSAVSGPLNNHVETVRDAIIECPDTLGQEPWLRAKMALELSTVLKPRGQVAGWLPGGLNAIYGPIGPSPVAAMIGTGLMGAGAGYGAGALTEWLMPGVFEKKRLRRLGAILGGIGGALPGLWWGTVNLRHGKSMLDSWPHRPTFGIAGRPTEAEIEKAASEYLTDRVVTLRRELLLRPEAKKAAWGEPVPLLYSPIIPVDQFQTAVWLDSRTPVAYRGATAGLVDAASLSRGGIGMISPADIARVAIGAGTGYASATLVGKVLGALAGVSPQAQKVLQQSGTWAGVITNALPLVFGG